MSRTHRDNQRRLDHKAEREWIAAYYSGTGLAVVADRVWRHIPRRGVNRKVARRWSWKLHKANRYRDEPFMRGRLRII